MKEIQFLKIVHNESKERVYFLYYNIRIVIKYRYTDKLIL